MAAAPGACARRETAVVQGRRAGPVATEVGVQAALSAKGTAGVKNNVRKRFRSRWQRDYLWGLGVA